MITYKVVTVKIYMPNGQEITWHADELGNEIFFDRSTNRVTIRRKNEECQYIGMPMVIDSVAQVH